MSSYHLFDLLFSFRCTSHSACAFRLTDISCTHNMTGHWNSFFSPAALCSCSYMRLPMFWLTSHPHSSWNLEIHINQSHPHPSAISPVPPYASTVFSRPPRLPLPHTYLVIIIRLPSLASCCCCCRCRCCSSLHRSSPYFSLVEQTKLYHSALFAPAKKKKKKKKAKSCSVDHFVVSEEFVRVRPGIRRATGLPTQSPCFCPFFFFFFPSSLGIRTIVVKFENIYRKHPPPHHHPTKVQHLQRHSIAASQHQVPADRSAQWLISATWLHQDPSPIINSQPTNQPTPPHLQLESRSILVLATYRKLQTIQSEVHHNVYPQHHYLSHLQ